jgi:hypothetical protein
LGGTVIYDKMIGANIPVEDEEEANELAVD